MLHLTFWSGVGRVTGANFLLEDEKTRILIDCGLIQGDPDDDSLNYQKFPYDPKTIDFLFVTHAHMDHIGRIGKLVRDGFSGTIFSTKETKELAKLMIEDAISIMEQKKRVEGIEMLYDEQDLSKTISLWKTLKYGENFKNEKFSVLVMDAGHILGSSMYEFSYNGKKIVFTGDSGNSPSPLLCDTEKIKNADYLVIDSVYGDRNHESKEERDLRFKKIISDTINSKGTIVIPAFSMERTQVLLYELNNLFGQNKLKKIPVFLDSPLAQKVTEIYRSSSDKFNNYAKRQMSKGDDLFDFPNLKIIKNMKESESLDHTNNPKIIIAGSGMSSGGRVIGHEINYLPDPKSTILLVGFQAIGTLGRKIQEKPKEIIIEGKKISVKAKIEIITGYSSHKDSDHLVEMVSDTADKLKKVFVVMGEPKSSLYLVQRLKEELSVPAIYPEIGKVYEIK